MNIVNNKLPLHKTAHFRRLREVILEVGNYEKINMTSYDLMNIKAYYVHGINLRGHNVSYNTNDKHSCWVGDNEYEFYEVPFKSNIKNSPYGKFLFFAYDIPFNYYLFGIMTVSLDKQHSINSKQIVESVYFQNYGRYKITLQDRINDILKTDYGSEFQPGTKSSEVSAGFDSYDQRKKAYNTSIYKILSYLDSNFAKRANQEKVNGKEPVKIYNKKKNH